MEKLKNLLKLDIIGWLLIALYSLGVLDSGFIIQSGIVLILVSKLCCGLGLKCGLCRKPCKLKE
tara:strand:+ start:1453 stop:1644 length:192 start_codon:yes stop_codon:yes gene_type:complete